MGDGICEVLKVVFALAIVGLITVFLGGGYLIAQVGFKLLTGEWF